MRKAVLAAFAVGAVTSTSLTARAQTPPAAQPLTLQREQLGSVAAADAARARARTGDCASALAAFDQAIHLLIDPTLRRDRGLCHEKLGNPYPAIDDFRAYLTAMPDALDATDITERLERLEAQVGEGGKVSHNEDPTRPQTASVTVSIGTDGKPVPYDSNKVEEDDESGPLRAGKGWVLAPEVAVRKWFNSNEFSSGTTAETVGLRLAYSFGEPSSLFLEAGYERFNVSDAEGANIGGLASQVGYEARFRFLKNHSVDNWLLLGIGPSFDYLVFTTSPGLGTASASLAGLGLRGPFGYRHNFSAKSAVEASLDGGVAKFFLIGESGSGSTAPWLGLNVALLFGL